MHQILNDLFTVYKKTQGNLTPKMKQQILPNSCHSRFILCLRILLKLLPLFPTIQLSLYDCMLGAITCLYSMLI